MSKRKSNNLYLKLRSNVWWYQRRVPKTLKRLYPDTSMISRSLKTSDIYIARKLRDQINAELANTELTTVNADAERFRKLVRELRAERDINPDWDMGFYPDRLIKRNDYTTLHAYETVNGKQNHEPVYAFTIREAYAAWMNRHGLNKSEETQRKTKQSIDEYLSFLGFNDLPMAEVSRRSAYDFLSHLEKHKAKTTCQAHMSRLKAVWKHSSDLGEVSGENPFADHSYAGEHTTQKKQMFDTDEVRVIESLLSEEPIEKQLYFKLALMTGCRLGELGNIRKRNLLYKAGVNYVFIEAGKTSSATRNVPIPDDLAESLKTLAENIGDNHPILGLSAKAYGRWFSVMKGKNISDDPRKCFHSFRVMFITALKRCDVPEYISAEIVGHQRGSTMSYGYYAKDNEIQKLYEHSQKAVEYIKSQWLQQS